MNNHLWYLNQDACKSCFLIKIYLNIFAEWHFIQVSACLIQVDTMPHKSYQAHWVTWWPCSSPCSRKHIWWATYEVINTVPMLGSQHTNRVGSSESLKPQTTTREIYVRGCNLRNALGWIGINGDITIFTYERSGAFNFTYQSTIGLIDCYISPSGFEGGKLSR